MDHIAKAREYALSHESPRRFSHTECVVGDCGRLARIFELDGEKADKLIFAAWLHDVTKEYTPAEHKAVCDEFSLGVPEGGYSSPTVHALTGAYVAKKLFPDYADDAVVSAIRYHTTGRAGMTLPEMLLCFADYSEPSRKYEGCKRLRAEFYGAVTPDNRLDLLERCLARSFEMTITSLKSSGDPIDSNTIKALDHLRKVLSEKKHEV